MLWKKLIALGLAAVIALGSALFINAQVTGAVKRQAESENMSIAQAFAATLWPAYREDLVQGVASARFNENFALVRKSGLEVRIYNEGGLVLFTTGGALSSDKFSELTQKVSLESPFHERVDLDGMKVHSLIAIGKKEPEVYIEIYRDISGAWGKVSWLKWLVGFGIFLLGLLWIFVLPRFTDTSGALAQLHEENQALARAAKESQAKSQEKANFLASIAHELRTPLNAIIGFSNVLQVEVAKSDNKTMQDQVNDIHQSGVHLLSLINDVLDFSKAEAGKLELDIEEVNVTKLVANCLRLVQPRAEAGNIELVNALPKQTLVVESDGKKLKQVLLNLLSNSVKFTPESGKVRIAAWEDEEEHAVVFQVSDSGVGMQPKNIARALSEFGQVNNRLSKRYEGTGLGLPLARKFVEVMGGKFGIQSEEGRGTTIYFMLPVKFKAREGQLFKRVGE